MRPMILLLFLGQVATANQGTSDSPRAAAVRYALGNGFEIGGGRLDVVIETKIPDTYGHPDGTAPTEAVLSSQAQEISRVVGHSATTASISALLHCVGSKCVPSRASSVLLVSQVNSSPENGATVTVSLYAPSDKPAEYDGILTIGIVRVEQRGAKWIGVGTLRGPTKVGVKLPRSYLING